MKDDTVYLKHIADAIAQIEDYLHERLHSAVPWSQIVGMRNRIAHDYLNVDMEIVWDIVTHDLPTLKLRIVELL